MCKARPNFVEKTFAGGSKPMKFVDVFSLKSFPLLWYLFGKLVNATAKLHNTTPD